MRKIFLAGLLLMLLPAPEVSGETIAEKLKRAQNSDRAAKDGAEERTKEGVQKVVAKPHAVLRLKKKPTDTEIAALREIIFDLSTVVTAVRHIDTYTMQIVFNKRLTADEQASFKSALIQYDLVLDVEFIKYR